MALDEYGRPYDDRARANTAQKPYEVLTLQDNHREIIRLAAIGMKKAAIAKELGITAQTVSNVLNSSIVQQHLNTLHAQRDDKFAETVRDLEELLPSAVEAYSDVLNKKVNTTPMQRIKAAGEVLDRVGPSKTSKVEHSGTTTRLTLRDLQEIKSRAERRVIEADVSDSGSDEDA